MNYENRIVLFLDILGFRNIIENTIVKDNEVPEKVSELFDNLEEIGAFVRDNLKNREYSTRVTQFSDSIIVSFLDEDAKLILKLIGTIQELLFNLVNKELLCRGAISYGKLIHTNRIVFGPALNDAYETESKAAMYPRVILDKSIIELGRKDMNFQQTLFELNEEDREEKILSHLKKDSDEKYYIDYFSDNIDIFPKNLKYQEYLENLREIIINGNKFQKPDLKVKYGWMKNKYNRLLIRLKRNNRIYELTNEPRLEKYLHQIKTLK